MQISTFMNDCHQILPVLMSEFDQINQFSIVLKPLEKLYFYWFLGE